MNGQTISIILNTLLERRVATLSTIKGCDDQDMLEIFAIVKKQLPKIYHDFMKTFGRGAGKFFLGTNIFFPGILQLYDAAEELIRENDLIIKLPEDAFIFAMHQGYEFMFFRCGDGDDPPVYYFLEGMSGFERKYPTFSAFLLSAAESDW